MLSRDHDLTLSLYALGTSTLNPYSVAQARENAGIGFVDDFLSSDGVLINVAEPVLTLMKDYCIERHKGVFFSELEYDTTNIPIYRVQCILNGDDINALNSDERGKPHQMAFLKSERAQDKGNG